MLLRIRLQRSREGLQVGEAKLVHDAEHLRLVALHLVQADLVDLRRRLVQRRALAHQEGIVRVAVRQRPDTRLLAAVGNVRAGEKFREVLVRRQHLRGNRVQHILGNAFLVGGRNRRGKHLQRQRERAVGRFLRRDPLRLRQHLLHQILGRRALVVGAGLHVRHNLRERVRDLAQPRNVVVVIVGRIERGVLRQLRQVKLDAVVLVHRHLPLFERRAFLVFDQRAQHQLGGELLLLRQPVAVDGGKAVNVTASARERVVDRAGRVVGQLRVVALVAEVGRVLRIMPQLVLPDVVEQVVQLARTRGNVLLHALRRHGRAGSRQSLRAQLRPQRNLDCHAHQEDDGEFIHGTE